MLRKFEWGALLTNDGDLLGEALKMTKDRFSKIDIALFKQCCTEATQWFPDRLFSLILQSEFFDIVFVDGKLYHIEIVDGVLREVEVDVFIENSDDY